MKLSEMSTDQLTDCLCMIAEPIGTIAADAEVLEVIKSYRDGDMTMLEQVGLTTRKLLPLALKKHRADLYAVVSALTGKTAAEIANQNGLLTIREAMESVDRDLLGFFKSAKATEQSA